MTDIVLIRPGSTDFDEQNRIQGTLDLPLNQRGLQQVDTLVEQLHGTKIEVIYTAPCEPARSTAEAIGENLDVPVKEKKGLRNLDHGLWQGLQLDEVRRKFPKVYKQWQDSPETVCPPEGETVAEAISRIRKALEKPLKKKSTFGVVVSEPLATLVSCVLENRKPEICDSHLGNGEPDLVKLIHFGAAAPVDKAKAENSIDKN